MFGKIKSKLSAVFSKTQDVIEEEFTQEVLEDSSNSKSTNSTQDVSNDIKEEINQIVEDEKRLDRLEQELEDEIDETSREVKELDLVDSEELRKPEIVELEHEQQDLDRLEQELENEIDETTREVEELEHISSEPSSHEPTHSHKKKLDLKVEDVKNVHEDSNENSNDEFNEELDENDSLQEEVKEEVEEKRGGFFSGLFKRKKVEQVTQEIQEESDYEKDVDTGKTKTLADNEQNNEEKNKGNNEYGSEDDNEDHNKDNLEEVEEKKEAGFLQSAFSSITQKKISQSDFDTLWAELELFLLEINIAYEIVEKIEREMKNEILGHKFSRFSLKDKIKEVLISEITQVMKSKEAHFDTILNEFLEEKKPVVIMMLGVNGTGKTTSIGKIIKHLQDLNKSVVVAAADTFRAAAVEQVEEHCNNLGVKCVRHKQGADPAAVCYDAIEHAKAKSVDVVLIDTAGRMPNNKNLMEELKKIKRVSQTDIVMFIGDSVSGNDLLEQIELFDKGLGISGVVLTKVDTDERPGSVVTTAYSIDAPIYFLGTGQRYEDLVKFDAKFVAEQLFNEEE
ncbi:MAG: signal recognition particle-docking protein FtsY [Nanoarchaeota archaeon]|nr:signal recognition particle-docking protein FtsY [Nanoarchaeota archaeon]